MNNKLWVVGKITNVLNDGWDFIGIFSDEPLAINAIESAYTHAISKYGNDDKSSYFIAPAQLNEALLCSDGSDWHGGYFPFK